jgi:hypothetical protein
MDKSGANYAGLAALRLLGTTSPRVRSPWLAANVHKIKWFCRNN